MTLRPPRIIVALILLASACPPSETPPTDDYPVEQLRDWRVDCEFGRGPNPECPEQKPK